MTEFVDLDEIDKAIVRELQVDGRASFAALAPKVGLSQAATRQRVNRLVDTGVMQVVAVTDPTTLGLGVQAMCGVAVGGNAKDVAESLSAMTEVEYVVLVSGRFDLLVEIVCPSSDALLDIVNDRIRAIEGVRSVEVFTYLRLVKQTYSWGTG